MLRIRDNTDWAAGMVAGFPELWQRRILAKHASDVLRAESLPSGRGLVTAATQQANITLREIVDRLGGVRLSLGASDAEICTRAAEFAAAAMDLGRIHHSIEAVRAGMASFVRSCQIEPPGEEFTHGGAIGRMTCRNWWRRNLRNMHAKAVEGAAIELGYVNRARELYVSDETVARRRQQVRRNQKMMESTIMRNELEQEFTLAELAAKGTANKAIRRGELMMRIAGLEVVARDLGHAGLFLTITCPSRMHRWVSAGNGRVFENTKYDKTSPSEAQKYLSSCWELVRSALARRGVKLYGVRVAEPHHEGCPHWHMLFFHESEHHGTIIDVFRRYMLADSPDEKGAQEHRVKAEVIDWSRGSAAGYIAKYVAKNIDGLHFENDLYGNPAMETSLRVDAWAATWRIRQFQQIGGAPVGVWREIRRIKELPLGAPAHLVAAHRAANKIEATDGVEAKAADFAEYVMAQGGPRCGRKARIRLAKESSGEIGRYGEQVAPAPVGVETEGTEVYSMGIVSGLVRSISWLVRSVRHVWQVVTGRVSAAVSSPPWTRVNNCTQQSGAENEKVGFCGFIFDRGRGDRVENERNFAEMAFQGVEMGFT